MASLEIAIVLALIGLLTFLFVREVLPIPITALLSAAALMLIPARSWDGAILTTEEGLSGFSSPATIAVLAMFVLSAGIERTGAIAAVTKGLMRMAGKGLRRQMVAIGLTAGPLSGVVNNTPVVAVMMPAATRMARHGGHSPSKLLIPLSYLAMLGGILTLIGSSTNLLGNSMLPRLGVLPFGFFEFTLVGAVALAVGLLYFLLIGPWILPDRGRGDVVERFDLKGFLAEYEVPDLDDGPAGKTLAELGLGQGGVQVVRLVRGDTRYDIVPLRWHLHAGDLLLVEGSREILAELPVKSGLVPRPEANYPWPEEGSEDLTTAEVVITVGSRYVGRTVAEIDFRNRHDVLVIAVRHHGRAVIGPMANARLMSGSVLLVQGTPKAIEFLRERPDLYVTRERPTAEYRREKLPHAVLLVAAVVAVAALGWVDIAVAAIAGAAGMVILGCLRLDEFLRSVRWDIILLLAGIIPLGIALEKTGAAALLGQGIVGWGIHLPPLVFLMVLFVATSLITEVVSNNASVLLLLPIAVAAANGVGVDPRPVALTVMLAASTSMLTPIGYQTNTMVFSPGGYRFSDFARVGAPLNAMLAFVIPYTIVLLFPL